LKYFQLGISIEPGMMNDYNRLTEPQMLMLLMPADPASSLLFSFSAALGHLPHG